MTEQEILDPAYTSRAEAAPVLNRALRNFRTAKRTTLQVMADLRILQDRGAHILYGEPNFATWAESTFDGLKASNIKQLTRAGGVLLGLEKWGRIHLTGKVPIGSTGLRELSVVANTYGDGKMIEVYDAALKMVEDRDITEATVRAAMRLLMPPAATDLDVPEALDAGPDGESEDELDEEIDDGLSARMRERIDRIRDLAWDLPATAADIATEVAKLQKEDSDEPVEGDAAWLESGR